MCGRFAQDLTWRELFELYNLIRADVQPDPRSRYNGAPGQDFGVCRADEEGNRKLVRLRWGLVPSWTRTPGSGLINARAETVDAKPSFRAAFRSRRCLVPASGWFEWKKTGTGKQPWYLTAVDGRPLSFAGLWEEWSDGDTVIGSFTIVTTTAGAAIEDLHHRQPAIIGRDRFDQWLDRKTPLPELLQLVRTPPQLAIERRVVSMRVNAVRNDDPDILLPEPAAGELF